MPFKSIEQDEAEREILKRKNRYFTKKTSYMARKIARQAAKNASRLEFAVQEVKHYARKDTWSGNHADCFRCSPSVDGKGESDAHLFRKFQIYLEYRKLGYTVFVEERIILPDGTEARPDLIICAHNGSVEVVEIAESESEQSLKKKSDKYPWPVTVVRSSDE